MPKVKVSLRSVFYKMIEFINFSHFRSLLTLDHSIYMRYYPINLDIRNRKCLVVGGGSVGTRKVISLLDCGAAVTVVSPRATEKLLELAR